jgi:hypothetical protein
MCLSAHDVCAISRLVLSSIQLVLLVGDAIVPCRCGIGKRHNAGIASSGLVRGGVEARHAFVGILTIPSKEFCIDLFEQDFRGSGQHGHTACEAEFLGRQVLQTSVVIKVFCLQQSSGGL